MKRYEHIFFDLDHTLWDYDTNVRHALHALYGQFGLQERGIHSPERLLQAFNQVNFELWAMYDKGEVDKVSLRQRRFPWIFEVAEADPQAVPAGLEEAFMQQTSSQPGLMPHALDLLHYLKPRYPLHIITNGFDESQALKMRSSGLSPFFELVVTSETTGHKKPDRRIFDYALERLQTRPEACLMVGDNPNSDMLGALNAGIDRVFYTPNGRSCQHPVTHTIRQLDQLKSLL
ncbi:HAD superfamily hydrolase [Nitritalea halalkaliphila LW7]|uniref:HAD superfamily hydrolase n=1 Tax=Nitritalea halalkaliphila LW7 TaxID=1189621 RepID=I5BZX6_9BACT|nr:YjjG family noncanonical pyrimidine nucleotidase [Nitritalea halalkaliphila]EIM75128.1 HAD superfamily hydrolase [Nitritalea halalkaliphila LW7]